MEKWLASTVDVVLRFLSFVCKFAGEGMGWKEGRCVHQLAGARDVEVRGPCLGSVVGVRDGWMETSISLVPCLFRG